MVDTSDAGRQSVIYFWGVGGGGGGVYDTGTYIIMRTVDGQDEQQTPNIGLRQRSVPESKARSVHAQPAERLPLRVVYGAVHLVNKHTLH